MVDFFWERILELNWFWQFLVQVDLLQGTSSFECFLRASAQLKCSEGFEGQRHLSSNGFE